ncbi:MAG: gliding motility-associated-like protein [Vicingaceae bacterium]|jgi:gliding motility-associated-like protein
MKKIVLYLGFLVSFFLLPNQADATHIMGGEVTWVCNALGEYIFTFKTYRDCSGAANGGPNTNWRIQNYPNVGQTFTLTENTSQRVDGEIGPNCRAGSPGFQNYTCAAGDPEVVFEYVRVMNSVRLNGTPPPAGWIVTYTQAARNANNNLLGATTPNAHNITLRAKIFSHSGSVANQCIDNSPQFREKATSLICRGSSFTYNHNATDDELDSLVYEWTSPLDGFTGTYNEGVNPAFIAFEPGFSFNNPFPGPETLNSATGEISVNSPTAGKYVSAVRVSAYKCGEKVSEIVRELQSVITGNCAITQTKPTIDPPFSNGMGGFRYNDTVRAGDLVTFSLAARDIASLNLTTIPPYFGDTVFLTATGQQFGTNFTSTTGCLNPPCATLGTTLPAKGLLGVNTTFSWQTDCNHVSFTDRCISGQNTYTFVITATDDECPIPSLNISTISITVVGDTVIESPDVNCVNVLANGDVVLDWDLTPNINSSFTAWMIYSATDRNGPFVLLDSVKTYSTNTYTHIGANANNQPMHYVVRSRSGCKGIVQNIAKDTISTIFVSATTNPTNVAVNWNAISNPNPAGSAAQYRVFREYPIGTGFNLYQSTANTSLTETFTPCADDVNYRVELVNASKSCTSSSNILNYTFKFPDPQTNFSFPNNQCPGTPITFTNLTTIAGGPLTYSWDFGDGSAASTQTSPTHSYAAAGTYNVILTATSGQGCDSILSQSITITFPNADAGANQAICPGGSAPIGGTPTTASGNTVVWSPAAGLSSITALNPIASPVNTTTYTVTVTDGNGCTNTAQVDVVVIPFPNANAGGPKSVCFGSGVQIGGIPTGPIGATYAWSSNPTGFTSIIANPTVSPTVNTTYTVIVTIGSGTTCSDTDNALVIVNSLPTADAGPNRNICPGASVQIGVAPSAGFTYSWTPTTGLSNANIANPIATPTSPTTYTVVITETATGCFDDAVMDVFFNSVPTPAFTVDKTCINQITEFTDASTIATGTITTWTWDFDDLGATSTAQNPTHQFSASGTYQVKLVATSNLGCKDSITVPVVIDPKPTVDFTFANLCLNNSTQFTDGSTIGSGAVNTWSWDFDGLGSSVLQNPSFTFPAAGTYDVKLVSGSGAGCLDSITKQIIINPLPTADAGTDQGICNTFSVVIGGSPTSSTPNVSYSWDNSASLDNSTIANPTATPVVTTRYSLTVTENTTSCFDTSSVLITVNPIPVVNFTVADTCVGNTTLFTDVSTLVSGTIANWSWDFGDGVGTSTQQNPSYTYTLTGTYNAKLVVETGIGCKDSLTRTITVVSLPNIDAGADQVICDRDTVTLGGTPTSSTAGVTYLWDNAVSLSNASVSNPIAFPSVTTRYRLTVTETATGCNDTASVVIMVNPVPVASFTVSAVCENEITQFTDGSSIPSGTIVSWTWDFGDLLGTSTQQNPTYQYAGPGTYQVKIVVESALGCKDSIINSIIISPKPTPSFTVVNLCENDVTQFTDASSIATGSITSWSWDFGDGVGTSNSQNPAYTFVTAGTFNVKLVVISGFGCTDSITLPVTINPLPSADAGADQVICNTGTIQIGGIPSSITPNVSYLWDNTGSLNNNTLPNPIASPTVTTRYNLTVTENTTGCFDTSSVLVTVNPIPVVDFSVADTCIGNVTLFTDASTISVGSITGWSWDFGDGVGTSNSQSPTYTYVVPNIYSVKLIVTSSIGCTDSITKTVTVVSLPGVDAGADQAICLNDSVTIGGTPTSTGTNVSYAWDNSATLDDNTIANPIAKPLVSTRYKLTVTDLTTGCFDTTSVFVVVNSLPNADFRASKVCTGNLTQFTDLSNIVSPALIQSWSWDFGDNVGTSILQNPSYQYQTPGSYTVKLIVTTNSGCLDSISRNVIVDTLPLAEAGADRTICELDTTILGKTAVSGETYLWDNATSLTDATIAQPGAFPIVDTRYFVTVTNSNGCVSIDSVDITVVLAPNVDAGNDLTICDRDTITIGGTPTSIEPGVTYLWNNATSLDDPTLANPIAFPSDTTSYVVTVTDATGCSSTDTMIVNVNPLANVDFRVDADCEGDFAAFTDISTVAVGSIVSWSWNFGDGVGTSTLQNPGYQYASPGTYSVFLEVRTALGCIDSIRKDVTIFALPIADAGSDVAICFGDTVSLGGNPTGPIGSSYSWSPGFDLSSVIDSNPRAYPTSATLYYLTVTGANGCFSYDTVNIDVKALPIVTAQKDSSLCVDQPVQLSAAGASTYNWSPANYLDDPSIATPIARALKSTNFIVTGTGSNGCIATDTVFIDVFNLDFSPIDTAICSGDSVVLAPVLEGDTNGISYLWSSSNPNNVLSSITDSSIKVTAATRQYFTLQIQNALGCVDTDSIYVNMKQAAEVDFDYLNSPRCQNSIIEILNISTFTDNYIWKLNGQVVSRERNPDFEINNLVKNTVTLIGSNLTCADSTTEVIEAAGLRELLQLKDANVFTPNGDGLNDIFDPGFEGEFIGCVNFQIFDRWGEKVFDSNIGQYGWDGVTLRGERAKVGVYFYIIRIGSEEIKGSVYLSR